MKLLGVLLLLVAGGLAYLTEFDRMSPTALSVVELETSLGFPLAPLAAVAGVLLLVMGIWSSLKRPPAPREAPSRPHPTAPPAATISPTVSSDWVSDVISRARALSLEDGATIRLDEGSGIPFTLKLERTTPEITRRSLDAFSAFLSSIPTPPRAKIIFVGDSASSVPRHHAVKGSLQRNFHTAGFQVVPQQNWVDVLFFRPDPCWADRPFLFLDS